MDFETNSKIVADSVYDKDGVSNFMAIISDCRHLLSSNLVNSDVSFIRRQAYSVTHGVKETFSDCRHLLSTDLINSYVSFIRRQANNVTHGLVKEAL